MPILWRSVLVWNRASTERSRQKAGLGHNHQTQQQNPAKPHHKSNLRTLDHLQRYLQLERTSTITRLSIEKFQNLANKVSTHIFRINSNVSGLQKLIDLLGSSRDTSDIRKKLHDLTESTREFIKNSSSDAKKLASWQVTDSYKIEQQKVSRDYASSIQAFQRVSRLSVERQKQFVDRVKSSNVVSSPSKHGRIASQDIEPESHELSETRPQFQQQQQLQLQQQLQKPAQRQQDEEEVIPDYELDYQEALIEERENEIREIEVGINELNQIFRDLGTIVQEQGGNIDNIESNVHRINNDMSGAVAELHQAHEYQKKSADAYDMSNPQNISRS
ncbi:uncharacterized protein PGTG_16645 [Puccinia graminis f. sp. tritici CRL 75-36-700-3]|uniref:t-SNARE coiled-coil homology domain-containing protein n=1 Tax=Puccinia graminis f. sp. tritici (strain CRL 75-36-700-3 / race SCCL) TaxID=418459 RepID=E3L244_PUCGT|nr:uncharacterized protein PGTG_16645 [Puccinia graminis f. sp. tritici CRL 75-36-700-3]EFP90619.2 hypothetical protein PGTG_16645 [Puccinia graminis f. sp. tritici CRL 75-36-700-3]